MWIDPSGYMAHPDKDANEIFDIVEYKNKTKGVDQENHHAVLDVWAKNNIPGYNSKLSPTIVLTSAQYNATKSVFAKWKIDKVGFRGKIDWKNLSPKEVQNLAELMFDAAEVPNSARKDFYSAFNKYLYSL